MGFSAEKTFDMIWIPSEKKYREKAVHLVQLSIRRMSAKYKSSKGSDFVGTLNGSGTMVGRLMIALIENYQNEDEIN